MSDTARKTAQAAKDFWLSMKSQPRSMKHGHRRPSQTTYSNPADGASDGPRRSDAGDAVAHTFATYNFARAIQPPAIDPGMMQAIADWHGVVNKMMAMPDHYLEDMMTPAAAPMPTLLTTGEIIGWRLWIVDTDGMLRSLTRSETVWDQHEPMAGDVDKPIGLMYPYRKCYAGVYAFQTEAQTKNFWYSFCADIKETFNEKNLEDWVSGICLGTVKLWGQVVEHEKGYRAEFARPFEIHQEFYLRKPQSSPSALYKIPLVCTNRMP